MVAGTQIAIALTPWLGTEFISKQEEMCSAIALKFSTFILGRNTIDSLASWVNDKIFFRVRMYTFGKMVLRMDTQKLIRLRMDDFTTMSDELMYLLFHNFPKDRAHFLAVQEYSVKQSSLSALRALYMDFSGFQSEKELATLRRVITSCYDKYRWRFWLEDN
ncbi:MAG: hypothetical protein ACOX54_06425 [Christensenellales bacterium]|jgi:hypothetical protein